MKSCLKVITHLTCFYTCNCTFPDPFHTWIHTGNITKCEFAWVHVKHNLLSSRAIHWWAMLKIFSHKNIMLCNYSHIVIPFEKFPKDFPKTTCNNRPAPVCKAWPGARNYSHTLFLPFIPSAQCSGILGVKLDKPLWPQIDHLGADEGALSALLWNRLLHSQATNKRIGTDSRCGRSARCTREVSAWPLILLWHSQTRHCRSSSIPRWLSWRSFILLMNACAVIQL